jgi:hypothetical protein
VEDIRHSVSWQGTFKGVLLDVAGCEENNAKYMEYFYQYFFRPSPPTPKVYLTL